MKKSALFILALIVFLLLARIIYVQFSKTEIVGEPPVKSLVFHKHWITVNPLEDTGLQDFVDMKLFYDFVANLDFDQALLLYGEPDNIREEEYNTYYEYSFNDVRIEVGREEYSTGDGIGVSWATYAYPYNKAYSEVLSPEISKHIDPMKEKTTVLVNNVEGEIKVLVNVVGTRVDEMILY